MSEPTDIALDLKEETLRIAYNSGLDQLINDISRKNSLTDFESQSVIPIPTDLIEEGDYSVSLSQEVKEYFDEYNELINNERTAFEFPFLITGKSDETSKIKATNIAQLNSTSDILNNEILRISSYSRLLTENILKAKEKGDDIYILGHTHPIPNQMVKQSSLTEKIDIDSKNKFHIKELGLNLSLQDLYQLVYFEHAVKGIVPPNSKIFLSVLMFSGEVCFVYIEDRKFKKSKVTDRD